MTRDLASASASSSGVPLPPPPAARPLTEAELRALDRLAAGRRSLHFARSRPARRGLRD